MSACLRSGKTTGPFNCTGNPWPDGPSTPRKSGAAASNGSAASSKGEKGRLNDRLRKDLSASGIPFGLADRACIWSAAEGNVRYLLGGRQAVRHGLVITHVDPRAGHPFCVDGTPLDPVRTEGAQPDEC